MVRTLIQCLIALSLFVTPSSARAPLDLESEYAAAKQELLPKLTAFAEWCGSVKLYLERDRAFEALLRFDPSNETAHRALKHTLQRDGSWAVPEKRPEVRNYGSSLKEAVKRRAELVAEFRSRCVALVEANKATLTPAARDALYADVVAIDGEDVASRALVGEVKRGEQWVLVESESAVGRRNALKDMIKAAVAGVPAPAAIEARSGEQNLGIAWTALLGNARVRVLSSGGIEEARKVATMCSAAADVFKQISGASQDLPKDFTVYLMTTPVARDSFIGGWPGWSAEERTRLKTWAGSGVPGDVHIARWDADEPRRLDGAVRHVLGLLTLLNFGYDHQKCAWAWEGVGLYLTRELVGTRYTWYSTGPSTGDSESKELLGKLMMTDVNWMNECFQRAKRNKSPKIAALCERRIDQFGVDEILTANAFAAYLIEGRPEALNGVFKRIAAEGSAKALAAALDVDMDKLDQRFVRWMSERK